MKNIVGQALVSRIKRAHSYVKIFNQFFHLLIIPEFRKQEKFRVYVVLPLFPGFDNINAIQAVQYYNLRSINIGKYSIYQDLKQAGIEDPSVYITFHGMRNYAVLMNKLVQEIIYVHSKLMIVDDKHVICGSANINDRSLLGNRDSELAAVISDCEFVNAKFNDVKVQVGKYAQSLRHKIFKYKYSMCFWLILKIVINFCFRLHLGIYFDNTNRIDVTDCTSDAFYDLFRKTSKLNTETFDDVFKCIPSDNILTFGDLVNYRGRSCLNSSNPKQVCFFFKYLFLTNFKLNYIFRQK